MKSLLFGILLFFATLSPVAPGTALRLACPISLAENPAVFLAALNFHLDSVYRLLMENRDDSWVLKDYFAPYSAHGQGLTVQTGFFLRQAIRNTSTLANAAEQLNGVVPASDERMRALVARLYRRVEHITKFIQIAPELEGTSVAEVVPAGTNPKYLALSVPLIELPGILRRRAVSPAGQSATLESRAIHEGQIIPAAETGHAELIFRSFPPPRDLASGHPVSLLDLLMIRVQPLERMRTLELLRQAHVTDPEGVAWSEFLAAGFSPLPPRMILGERLRFLPEPAPDFTPEDAAEIFARLDARKLRTLAAANELNAEAFLEGFAAAPYLQNLFDRGAGVAEGLSLREHTLTVLRQFEHYFAGQDFPSGLTRATMRIAIAIHDLGKPRATTVWPPGNHHVETREIATSLTRRLGLTPPEVKFISALIDGDPIGPMLKASADHAAEKLAESAEAIRLSARQAAMPFATFFNLLLAFYMSDASSYTPDAGGAHSPVEKVFIFDRPGRNLRFAEFSAQRIEQLRESIQEVPVYFSAEK